MISKEQIKSRLCALSLEQLKTVFKNIELEFPIDINNINEAVNFLHMEHGNGNDEYSDINWVMNYYLAKL